MKKVFLVFAMAVVMSLGLVGCGSEATETFSNESPTIIVVEDGFGYDIAYHKDTKVMYIIGDQYQSFEVMLNADGSPMLYEENAGENS
jgi:uncharacterized lipoprotein YehR (DUF1307 family)